MKIDIMTLFPDAIDAMMGQSIIGLSLIHI